MRKQKIAVIIGVSVLAVILLLAGAMGGYFLQQHFRELQYIAHVERELQALSEHRATWQPRAYTLLHANDGRWSDESVGVTADGYTFFFALHDPHGPDPIESDINIFYLPDERRFVIDREHICMGLNKEVQPKDKHALLRMIE